MLSVSEIKKKAKSLGISDVKIAKDDLIRTIQTTEGNFPCYKTADDCCDQNSCLWRDDCISTK